ncbi:MFS transporter [Salmonella enterica subsp. enterica serovar Typhimurium]|nr:MFS transporter [Salmonella enterica subsp. enterica serovar Typhimurium]
MTKPTHELSPALIVLMSVATGLAVASNYYAQPLLDTIAHHFSLSASSAGFIVTAAQLGYAAGLLFLVPLGDMFERRTLIVSMTLLAAGGMLITASSQSLSMMILALMALMAVALWRGLPKLKSDTHLNYPQLLGSVFSLFIHDKLLRTRALLGCLTFANFSILWTSMAFLLAAPPFSYSEGMIGLFGLAGAAGALGARPAGGFADKGKSHLTTTFGLLLLLLSWLAIWLGHTSVLALIIGILVLDLTVQGVHITNQTVIYRLHPDARNRLTAGYMTSYFIGGAAGSLISASAWQHAGWAGVCLAGVTVALLNLLVWWRGFHRQEAVN